jgi:hypothetical protein
VIALSLLCAAAVYLVSSASPVKYQASARVFLDGAKLSANGADPVREVQTQANLAVSGAAIALASEQLRLPPKVIVEDVFTEAAPTGNYFTVTGTSGTADGAVRLVSGIEQAYSAVVGQQTRGSGDGLVDQLVNQRVAAQAALDAAKKDLAAKPNDAQLQARTAVLAEQVKALSGNEENAFTTAYPGRSLVQLVETPQAPASPSAPRPKREALLGAVFGLLIATVLLWWRSDRLATAGTADVGAVTPLPRLAELTASPRKPWRRRGRQAARAASFADVALAVDLAMPDDLQVLLLTASRQTDLAPEAAWGIAKAFAKDRRVVLVDGQQDRPLARAMKTTDSKANGTPLTLTSGIAAVPAADLSPDSFIVPALEVRARDRRQAFSSLAAALRREADLAVVVVPPPHASVNAGLLASSADAAILIVCASTPLSAVTAASDRLAALKCPTLGYVLDRDDHLSRRRRLQDWFSRLLGRQQDRPVQPLGGHEPVGEVAEAGPLGETAELSAVPAVLGRAPVVSPRPAPSSERTSAAAAADHHDS